MFVTNINNKKEIRNMQVSVYLEEKLLRRVDEIARREKRSRSQVIQLILENMLEPEKSVRPEAPETSKYDRFFGCWEGRESAEELILQMRNSREKNTRFKKVSL